jgi:hypothetical protein
MDDPGISNALFNLAFIILPFFWLVWFVAELIAACQGPHSRLRRSWWQRDPRDDDAEREAFLRTYQYKTPRGGSHG